MAELRAAIARVAPIPSTVLIIGESGTGKELVARDLHRFGPQPSGAVRGDQLRRAAREPGRERAVRPRARRVHRRHRHPEGRVRGRRSAARSSSTRSASCRSRRRPSCSGCSRSGRSPGSAATRPIAVEARVVAATNRDLEAEVRGRPVPGGPLLPARRPHDRGCRRCATGCPTCRRWRTGSLTGDLRPVRDAAEEDRARRARPADGPTSGGGTTSASSGTSSSG